MMRSLISVVPAAILLLLVSASAGTGVAHAQGLCDGPLASLLAQCEGSAARPMAPSGVQVGNGHNLGEVILRWNAVDGAEFYRVGWLAVPDYVAHQDNDAWRVRFAYSDVPSGTSHTVSRLTPGVEYYFIVGSGYHEGRVYWPPTWERLTLNFDTSACPTAAPASARDYDADDDGLIDISNLAQLDAMRYDLDGDGISEDSEYAGAFINAAAGMGCPNEDCAGYELVADLDFDTNGNGMPDASDSYWNGGDGWLPIGVRSFSSPHENDELLNAVFEGNGHTISNLYIDRTETRHIGLFAATGLASRIRNVGLMRVSVTGDRYAGGVAGDNRGAIERSYATGDVKGSIGVGGLVGSNRGGIITDSYSAASASGVSEVGGLVGRNNGIIAASYAAGDVGFYRAPPPVYQGSELIPPPTVYFYHWAGGLVGANAGTVMGSYATGNVSGRDEIGGLVGENSGSITDSYAAGAVSGNGPAGGLVGANYGAILRTYAVGSVSASFGALGPSHGGLIGFNYYGVVRSSYWDIETTGLASSDAGEGHPTEALQSTTPCCGDIYLDWDPEFWDFGTPMQYPVLKYRGLDVDAQR